VVQCRAARLNSPHFFVCPAYDISFEPWLAFTFLVLPSSAYLFTAGVEVVYFRLITLRHTPQSVGLLWMRDRPVAETT
jgi:hypothetical protein